MTKTEEKKEKINIDTEQRYMIECCSCGAVVSVDNSVLATECVYCGNTGIRAITKFDYMQPDRILPFSITKEQAIIHFEKAIQDGRLRRLLVKDGFKDKKTYEEIKPVYVPYLIANTTSKVRVLCRRGKNSPNYHLYGDIEIEGAQLDTSSKTDDAYMDSLGIYDVENSVPYNSKYLVGTYSLLNDEDPESSSKWMKMRTAQTVADVCSLFSVADVLNVYSNEPEVSMYSNSVKCVLVPVWMLNIRFNDKIYHYNIHGRTGMFSGIFPYKPGMYNLLKVLCFIIPAILLIASIIIVFILEVLICG